MRMRLETRISSDFWVAIAALVLVAAIALGAFEVARQQAGLVERQLRPSVSATGELLAAFKQMADAELAYFPESPDAQAARAQFDAGASRFERAMLAIQPLAETAPQQEALLAIERDFRRFAMADARLRTFLNGGEVERARAFNLADSLETERRVMDSIGTFQALVADELVGAQAETARHLVRAELAMGAVGLLGALLGALLWRRASRAILEPIGALREAAHELGAGRHVELHHPQAAKTPEIEALQEDFNRMAARLQGSAEALVRANETLETRVLEQTRDLSAAKERLEQMVEELKGVDRVKSQLLDVMSHELLTPINFITGYGSALEDEVTGPLSREQRQAVGGIMAGAERLTRMVRNLLDYSKLGAGELAILPEPVDYFGELVRQAAEAMRPSADAKHQRLEIDVPTELPAAWADPARVQQIVGELLDNAIKFTGHNGRIAVRAYASGDQVVTEVADTGIGIPQDAIPNLLKPFYQADLSSTRAYGGLGLGLAIVHHLVARMGGTLMIDARLGHGTTVRVALPRADRRPLPAGARGAERPE